MLLVRLEIWFRFGGGGWIRAECVTGDESRLVSALWLVVEWRYTRSVGITPLLIGCSASCSEPGGYFEVVWLRLMLPLGCVGRKCPRLGLLREAVHPIRRHYTPSDRVHCDVTGAAPLA